MKRLTTNSLRSLLLLLLPLALPLGVAAQSLTGYNWYFGNSPQGVRFNRGDKTASVVNNQVTPYGTGGGAVANSAINGDLLFYSDGQNIYDVSNQPMPGGSSLGGNSAGNQAVAVAKVPGQENQYYVFVNSANGAASGSVTYRIVDMSLLGNAVFPSTIPLGEVPSATNSPLGLTTTSEAMTVIPQEGTENFWLITHDNGTNTYTVTLFTTAGPQPSTTYNVGVITQPGNFAYHAGTNKIAVSPQEANRNVEILDFNPLTGVLQLDQEVPNSAVTNVGTGTAVYDTEWSFSGGYLYISSEGEGGVPGNVMQFDVNNPALTLQSILPQPNTTYQSYGLQMAPDSSIYHLYQAVPNGPFLMGKISDTDSVAANVVYTPQAFPGNVNFGGTQFPSFAPPDTTVLTVSFTTKGTCANAPTGFFPTVTPGADSLRWDFGDGSGSSDWSPVYTYTGGNTYNVVVTAYLNGQEATATLPVTITDFDTQISLVQDTTACSCELPFPKAQNPPPQCGQFSVKAQIQGTSGTMQWFGPGGLIPGATSETLQPDSAGYYYLVVTVGTCATYAGVNIKEYEVEDQRANVWYFGNQAGIDFNPNIPNAPVPISNPVMNAPEGTSTISDRNGQVLFFTDGVSVWDRNFTLVSTPPPPGIGGSVNSAQSALIIPVAGDETLYYIFTTKDVHGDGTYELRYSLFDLKMNGGTGGMQQENVLLFARSTERITGNENWLIAHEYGNNTFRAYPISNLGIGNPVISGIGSDHSTTSAENGQGYMKLGPQNRLAVALSTPGTKNVVEVFDFNNTTGVISNFRTADLNNPNGQVYGVEFSSGGNKLFATIQNQGGGSQVVEFAFDSLAMPYLKKPPMQNSSVPEKLGAIQIGPDGQIYVAVEGQGFLGTIQAIDDTTQISLYTPNGFALKPGTNSTLGLPNFIQQLADPIQGPFMTIAGQCVLDSVTFSATPTDPIDKFFWQVRLGASVVTTSTAQEFQHLFTTPGLYDVSLRLTNRCGLDTTMLQQLRINDLPPDPSASAVLCTGAAVLDANPTNLPGLTYVWSTGDSTETISVNRRGYYDVTVTNTAGCSVDGRILAADNRPIVDLGDNLTICQNTPVAALDARNPGATYAWTLNGVAIPGGTRRTQAVNTRNAGPPTFEYEVTVTDPVTSCFVKDSVIYTINALPVITTPVASTIACGSTTGTIDLSITSPAAALFTYMLTGPSTSITDSDLTVGPIPQATGLAAGTYSITVADQVTTCAVTTAATINNNNFTVAGLQDVNCDPINIDVTITPTGPPSTGYTWRVIDTSLPLPPAGQGVQTGSSTVLAFNTSSATTGPIGLPSNSEQYIVEVRDAANCLSSSPPVLINHDPKVPALFEVLCADAVASPISITTTNVSPAATFLWTGANIVSGTNAATMQANPPAGTHTYQVLIQDAGYCPLDTTLTAERKAPLLPNISQTDLCADAVTVSVTPAGAYNYQWYIGPNRQPNLGGSEITVTTTGQQYSVRIYDPITGCMEVSNGLVVRVDGELTVELISTTPCEGSPFTLTATPNRTATFAWELDGSPISGQTAATLQEQRGGLYRVTASAATCKATDEIDITLAPVTPGLMNEEAYICPDPANQDETTRSVVLRPGEFASYDWLKDNVSLGINTPTLTADEPGLYTVLLENSFGCESSDKTNVLVECDPVIVGPNAFRPTSSVVGLEGDMVNQSFHLYTFFIDDEDFEVFIFNRWGEMIFQSGERDFRWNGGYKNNLAQLSPAGTYSYLVRYKSSYRPEKGIMEKRGGVVLMR